MSASLDNSGAVAEALDERDAHEQDAQAAREELAATRQSLEQAADPVSSDPAPDGTPDTDDSAGYAMTDARRVGTAAIPIEGHGTIRFGKPSGRASAALLEPVEAMDEGGGTVIDLGDYVWATLGSWAIDDEYDADFWADETALVDAIQALRQVALGGNLPGR